MSIDTTPPGGGPSPPPPIVCTTCFPVTTPDTIHLCLQGIRKGALWVGGDPEPPNDTHPLSIIAACHWTSTVSGIIYTYRIVGGFSLFLAQTVGADWIFSQVVFGNCKYWASNLAQVPAGVKYYGGWATALPEYEGVPFALPDLMSLMSEEIYWAQWLMPRPMAVEQVVYGIYDSKDHTNVRIKIDHS